MKRDIIKIIISFLIAAVLIPHNIYAFNGDAAIMNESGNTTGVRAYSPLPYYIFCIFTPMLFIVYSGWKIYKLIKGIEDKKKVEETTA